MNNENAKPNGYVSAWKDWGIVDTTITRSRASTFLALAASGVAFGVPISIFDALLGAINPISIVLTIASFLIYFFIFAQRFRDMGYSGWMSILTIIPFVSLWPLLDRNRGTCESCPNQVMWTKIWIGVFVAIVVLVVIGIVSAV